MTDLTFMQPVTVTHALERVWRDTPRAGGRKEWLSYHWWPAGREGFVMGRRPLSNANRYDYGDGVSYTADEHFTAYLVVFNLHQSPRLVLPEHITPKEPLF